MKKLYIFLTAAALSTWACQEQKSTDEKPALVNTTENADTATPKAQITSELAFIQFEKSEHDFGTLKQGDIVKHTFNFVNEGKTPLIISDIKTSCGCTTPQYTQTPVKPGEKGKVEVQFNSAGKSGIQQKTITINANIPDGSTQVVIKCNVVVDDVLEGPYNKKS